MICDRPGRGKEPVRGWHLSAGESCVLQSWFYPEAVSKLDGGLEESAQVRHVASTGAATWSKR